MKNNIIILLLLVASFHYTYSQDQDGHTKAVKELFTMLDMNSLMTQSIDLMINAQAQQDPAMLEYKDVMLEFFRKYLSWESLEDDFIRIYKESLTEEEILEVIEFYKTPVGQKMLLKLPTLMKQGAQIGQERVQANLHELEKMIREKMENQ